jgi:hypothetical protein
MSQHEQSLSDFTAALAPEVDRLFIAGHRAAQPHAQSIRKELAPARFADEASSCFDDGVLQGAPFPR